MEYQVTKPSFVRVNWTQVTLTFAACFVACLLAGGALYAIVYFIHRKPKAQDNGNDTEAQQQRPIRQKIEVREVENPQEHHEEKSRDEAQNDQEKDDEETDEKEPVKQTIQLNGVSKKKPLVVNG